MPSAPVVIGRITSLQFRSGRQSRVLFLVDQIVFLEKENAAMLIDELADMVEIYLLGDSFNDESSANRESPS
jgi:hypothetical protein